MEFRPANLNVIHFIQITAKFLTEHSDGLMNGHTSSPFRTCLRFAGSHPAEAIKIRSTPSFGGEVKPEAPCHKIFRHEKYHLQV
jgi:hypothetical protein